MFKKGFTLIELLVVIAVIGVLATAVIASINPIEQINKAKDTASKSDAAEFLKAAERYYATFQCYPWETTCPSTVIANSLGSTVSLFTLSSGTAAAVNNTKAVQEMESKQELKSALRARVNATGAAATNALFATTDANNLVHVCYAPLSSTFKAQAVKAAVKNDAITACVPATANDCALCIP